MKQKIKIILLGVCFAACGNSHDEKGNGDMPQAAVPNSGETVAIESERSNSPLPVRKWAASGQTEDGTAVTLAASMEGTVLSGTLSTGEIVARLSGVMDGKTIRAWLNAGTDAATLWQGNLIGFEKDGVMTGSFVMSDNGAQHIIKGHISSAE